MSTRLPCCFMVFYNYPSWRTGGSPFVPQVPGYLNTHIIHSFLTILKFVKPYVHVVLPSWIYRLFLISLRRLNCHNAPLVRKTQWKIFSFHGSQIERGYIRWGKRPHVCMVSYRDGKSNSLNLDKAFIFNGFSNWKVATWPLKTRPFQVSSWFGEGSK